MCVCGPEPGPAGSSTCWRPARVDFLENPACPAGLPPFSPGTPNCCWGLDCALWCCSHAEMQTDMTSWWYVLTGLPSIVLVESKAKCYMFPMSTCWVQSAGAAVCLKEPFFHFSGRHIPAVNRHIAAAARHTPLQERRVWSGMSRGWRGHSEAWGDEWGPGSPCSWVAVFWCCCCCVKACCRRPISSSYFAAALLQCSNSDLTEPRSACRAAISCSRSTVAASMACRKTRIWHSKPNPSCQGYNFLKLTVKMSQDIMKNARRQNNRQEWYLFLGGVKFLSGGADGALPLLPESFHIRLQLSELT